MDVEVAKQMNGQADGWNQNEAVSETLPSQAFADICMWWLDFLFLMSNLRGNGTSVTRAHGKGRWVVAVSVQCGKGKVFPTERCVLSVALQFLLPFADPSSLFKTRQYCLDCVCHMM